MRNLLFLCVFLCVGFAQAQDFEKFKALFPMGKKMMPPYAFDSAYFAKCEASRAKLKRLSYSDVKKHIHDKINPTDTLRKNQLFQNSGDGMIATILSSYPVGSISASKKYEQKAIAYYAIENLALFPNHTSLVVYYSDEEQKKSGLVNKLVILLTYDAKGELVSAINLVNYMTYMDIRLHTSIIDGNFTLSYKEQSFEAYPPSKKENYRRFYYYGLDYQKATFKSIQDYYYPYSGIFQAQKEGLEIYIDQNYNNLSITEGKIGASIGMGMNTKEYDAVKGTFTAVSSETKETWKCVFSEDKNTLTAVTPKGSIVYVRVKR